MDHLQWRRPIRLMIAGGRRIAVGHTAARTTELYAKHSPEFQSAAVAAINRVFALKFLSSSATKPAAGRKASDKPLVSLGKMVGATGIEPVTPTMSRTGVAPKVVRLQRPVAR